MDTKKLHIPFNPAGFSHRASTFVLGAAAVWNTSPQEAIKLIIESVARKQEDVTQTPLPLVKQEQRISTLTTHNKQNKPHATRTHKDL